MRNKIISREELLDLASVIIAGRGLSACSMRNLAVEAGIAVGTIYNYFPSREALLESVFERSWQKTIEKLRTVFHDSDESVVCMFRSFYTVLKMDVQARGGLGAYVVRLDEVVTGAESIQEKIFPDIEELLMHIVAKDKKYALYSRDRLRRVAHWLLILSLDCIVPARKQESREEEELISLFFSS